MIDNVNHPEHYTKGGVECIDAIRASMYKEGFAAYCKGNALKYLCRYKDKGGLQDLEKANVYLAWLIETEQELKAEMDARMAEWRRQQELKAAAAQEGA